jgi:hypothetical protein|tara:strand:- start:350 stop:841 length:492 start_codon:yes stop_codon:yes gene_type:complete
MSDLKKLSDEALMQLISPSSNVIKELKNRKIIRTKNIVGEIGEYYAIKFYNKLKNLPNLTLAPPGVKNVDALSRDGEIYSIKCISSLNGTTGSFWDPESIEKNNQKFHFLIIVILDENYGVEKILELTWEDFMKYKKYNKRMNNYNISITKTIINQVKIIYEK